MNFYRRKGFTLVELIVVITILSILATIGFIYVNGNLWEARDAKRISDIENITGALELYITDNGILPDPSEFVNITYSGATAWKQGTFGESVIIDMKSLWSDIPVDPLFENEFSYSVTSTNREYQIATIRENLEEEAGIWELVISSLVWQADASSIQTAYVRGNYNGFMVRAGDSREETYFIATPSLISNDLSSTDVIDIITNQNLVYDEFFNLPASYDGYLPLDGGFNFNVSDPLIFSGSVDDLRNEQRLLEFNSDLKFVYATTPTESFDRYVSLLDQEGITWIKEFLTKRFKLSFRSHFNCKDILDAGEWFTNGFYIIDPDGPEGEDPYEVFCDMVTDGGWWTRIGDNHIVNGDFEWGLGITNAIENDITTHQIVEIPTPIDSGYALHQTGNYSSNYQLEFNDPSILEPGYEIRMSLWRSDYGSGATSTWVDNTKILGGKSNPWTIGTCTNWTRAPSCEFEGFNRKLANSSNFWPGGALTEIDFSVVDPVNTVTTSYLNGWILFDGYIKNNGPYTTWWYTYWAYSSSEKEAIDEWVRAGGFLISTNDENDFDPLGEYYNLETEEYNSAWEVVNQWVNGEEWIVENVDHPIVNGSIGLWIDLRWRILRGPYRRSALSWAIWPDDLILARENRAPFTPTVVLRRHEKWYILITSGDGIFKDMEDTPTFDTWDLETVLAANIMTYAIETAAWINPREGYAFHNRIYYNDGTFSLNGEDRVVETVTIEDEWVERVWVKELVRHRIYRTPEEFNWHLGLDANNNKDLYFTWVRLELFYR